MKKKKRKIKPATDVSFGLFELAARSAGFSMMSMMGVDEQIKTARGIKKLQRKKR